MPFRPASVIMPGAIGVLVVACVILGLRLRDARAELARISREDPGHKPPITGLKSSARAGPPPPATAVAGGRPAAAASTVAPGLRAAEEAPASPEVEQLRTVRESGRVERQYGSFFRRSELVPATLKQLKALLVERQLILDDVLTTARAQGIDPATASGRAAVNDLTTNLRNDYEGKLRELVGPEKANELRTFEQTMPQRNTADAMALRLSNAGLPVTESQVEQLVALISPARPGEGRRLTIENGVMLALLTDDVIERLRPVLSPAQVEIARTMRDEQQARQSLARMGSRGPQPPGPAGPPSR